MCTSCKHTSRNIALDHEKKCDDNDLLAVATGGIIQYLRIIVYNATNKCVLKLNRSYFLTSLNLI